jgi:hypothetical protein
LVPVISSLKSALLLSATVTGVSVAEDDNKVEGDQLKPEYWPETVAFSLTCVPGATRVSLGKSVMKGDGLTRMMISFEVTGELEQAEPPGVSRQTTTSLSETE